MSEKWTPGPWASRRSLRPVDGRYDYAISGKDAPVIAEAFGRSADGGLPPAEANARLIAAAPDLFDALEFIAEGQDVGRHDGLPEDGPVHDAETMFAVARRALAKARGEA